MLHGSPWVHECSQMITEAWPKGFGGHPEVIIFQTTYAGLKMAVPTGGAHRAFWACLHLGGQNLVGRCVLIRTQVPEDRFLLYLSGTSLIAPTQWVFRGWCHCGLISANCVFRRWGYVGYIRKALEKGYLEHPGLHAVLTTCLRFLSVLDDACVACCCLFLSPGSYHVRIQVHSLGYCFPGCTTETFGA